MVEFDHAFEVPLPPDEAFRTLLDIERVAGCIPGATLTAAGPDRTYRGAVAVKLGPIALSLAGQAMFESIDEAARTARVRGRGTDAKGRGGANSTFEFRVDPHGDGSRVSVHTSLALSGPLAQYGRAQGVVRDLAGQMITQFAACLRARVEAARAGTEPGPSSTVAQPVAGLSALARAVGSVLRDRQSEG